VQRWQEDANLQGAWVWMETVSPQATLRMLTIALARQGAVGIVLPQQPTPEGYLSMPVGAVSPSALPMITVRADLLPTAEGQRMHAHIPT
jgi:aminopeptidase YwaD